MMFYPLKCQKIISNEGGRGLLSMEMFQSGWEVGVMSGYRESLTKTKAAYKEHIEVCHERLPFWYDMAIANHEHTAALDIFMRWVL